MKKTLSYFSKFLLTALFVFAGVVLAGYIRVKADIDPDAMNMVRVSNTKQLQKAINDPDVNVIIFKTYERDTFKIKANKNAQEKVLVIDAPNGTIVNRSKFYMTEIKGVMFYYENVSGNNIIVDYNPELRFEIVIGKNKTVDSLTITTLGTVDDRYNCYYLRKGAKINDVRFAYSGLDDISISEYDADKNQISLNYTDDDLLDRSYVIKLDSRGRIKRMISKKTFKYDYKFKYNKNGKKIKLSGDDDDDKNILFIKTVKGDYTLKETFECDNRTYEYEYFFKDDSTFMCPYKVTYVIKSQDSEESWVKTYTYDEKDRVVTMHAEYSEGYICDMVNSYNSKDFPVKEVYTYTDPDGNQVADTVTILFEYNKAGDLTKRTTVEGDKENYEAYEYDELGYVTGIKTSY